MFLFPGKSSLHSNTTALIMLKFWKHVWGKLLSESKDFRETEDWIMLKALKIGPCVQPDMSSNLNSNQLKHQMSA